MAYIPYIQHPCASPFFDYVTYIKDILISINIYNLKQLVQIKIEVNCKLNQAENVVINDNVTDADIISKLDNFNNIRNKCISDMLKHFNEYINLHITKKL